MRHSKYLIIGGSAAGVSAANCLARLDPQADILCVTAEVDKAYNKCFLVDWLTGDKTESQLHLAVSPQIKWLYNNKVISLDILKQIAYLSDGQQISYDKVLLAIGVSPFIPRITGLDQAGHVFNFHSWTDTQKIQNFIQQYAPKKAVIIGAGLTGVECADALWRSGLQVSIIERSSQILGKLIDAGGAQSLQNLIKACNVNIYLDATVAKITQSYVVLTSDEQIKADLVILTAGVCPNKLDIIGGSLTYLGNYVKVDGYLQTNLPNVWAAGDMIVAVDLLTGELVPSCSWPDAMLQGNLAAQNMVGKVTKEFPKLLSVANSRFFGKDFISLGNLVIKEGYANQINQLGSDYQNYILDQNGQVKGALLIGDISNYPALKRSILTCQPWVL